MRITCEQLFLPPQYTQVQLSDGGKCICYIHNVGDKKVLCRYDLEEKNEKTVSEIRNEMKLIGTMSNGSFYYLAEHDGYLDTLYINEQNKEYEVSFCNSNIRVLECDEKLLIFAVSRGKSATYDLYGWDYETHETSLLYYNDDNSFKWQFGCNGELKVKYIDIGDHIELLFKQRSNWEIMRKYSYSDYWRSHVVFWDENNIYMKERGDNDTFSLVSVEISNPEKRKVEFSANYDLEDIIVIDCTVVAISYYVYRKEWEILDSKYKRDFEIFTCKSYGDLKGVSYSKSSDIFLLTYALDCDVKKYYTYIRRTGSMDFLFCSRKTVDSSCLSRQKGFKITASDGIPIEGYISSRAKTNHKLIVKIHGGPTQRAYWGYNSITQFFASRDYICVEPNYRGSFGYGKTFEDLLDKEMGNMVTNDINDCINYMLGKYEIDEIYLFGWSAGGYIAMMTAIKHNIVHLKGVIAVSAPLEMEQIVNNSEKQGIQKRELAYLKFGNPDKDKTLMSEQSVLNYEISFPLLYAYGKYDHLMEERKIDKLRNYSCCKVLGYDDNHAIQKTKNRLDLFKKIDEFID